MKHNPDEALSQREHWAKYVLNSVPPRDYIEKVISRYKEVTGRTLSNTYVTNIKAGRQYDRLVHLLIYEISDRAEGAEVLGHASNPPRKEGGRSLAPVSR